MLPCKRKDTSVLKGDTALRIERGQLSDRVPTLGSAPPGTELHSHHVGVADPGQCSEVPRAGYGGYLTLKGLPFIRSRITFISVGQLCPIPALFSPKFKMVFLI